jgi:hypothetical protein
MRRYAQRHAYEESYKETGTTMNTHIIRWRLAHRETAYKGTGKGRFAHRQALK